MKLLQKDLQKLKNKTNILYKIKDLQCKTLILSGFKNNIKDDIYFEKKNGVFQKIDNYGYWVWLDKKPLYIFWLSYKKLVKDFNILYCYSNIVKNII